MPTLSKEALYPLHKSAPQAGPVPAPPSVESFVPLRNFLRDQELAHLNRALELSGGDKEKAALLLGVSLATLYRKLAGEDREP